MTVKFVKTLTRREFLRTAGAAAAAGLLAGCTSKFAPTTIATSPIPQRSPQARVGVAKAAAYDRQEVKQQVQALLDSLGGLSDAVDRGGTAVLKVNLTGGAGTQPKGGGTAVENFVTHPEVVRAVGECLLDSGAKSLAIVEAVWSRNTFSEWGCEEVARSLGAQLIDLNRADPYPDFAVMEVGDSFSIYDRFKLNRILQEAGTFVSIAKLKTHCSAGVTLAMKNLVGIAPLQFAQYSSTDVNRTAFHGSESGVNTHLPRVIVDLNLARPIHLAVIDGIHTIEGGEGPWNAYNNQVKPGVLLAGKNAVSTDAVGTALMGFDPQALYPDPPFTHSDNHLAIASEKGLGANLLDEIEVVGALPDEVRMPFTPCYEW